MKELFRAPTENTSTKKARPEYAGRHIFGGEAVVLKLAVERSFLNMKIQARSAFLVPTRTVLLDLDKKEPLPTHET